MATTPDGMVLKRDRDLVGRRHEIWVRRVGMGLICAVPIIALFNVFGQRPQTTRITAPALSLSLNAPTRLRSGLLFTAKFDISANRELKKATRAHRRWNDGMQESTG